MISLVKTTWRSTTPNTKLGWGLAADEAELQALLGQAEDCPATLVSYEPTSV